VSHGWWVEERAGEDGAPARVRNAFRRITRRDEEKRAGLRVLLVVQIADEPARVYHRGTVSDEAAWEAHESSEYGKNYFPRMRAILESITVEYFDVTVP
jgi:hypothetical protein